MQKQGSLRGWADFFKDVEQPIDPSDPKGWQHSNAVASGVLEDGRSFYVHSEVVWMYGDVKMRSTTLPCGLETEAASARAAGPQTRRRWFDFPYPRTGFGKRRFAMCSMKQFGLTFCLSSGCPSWAARLALAALEGTIQLTNTSGVDPACRARRL